MIRHLVFFNLKPDLEPADREWLFSQIQIRKRVSHIKVMDFVSLAAHS